MIQKFKKIDTIYILAGSFVLFLLSFSMWQNSQSTLNQSVEFVQTTKNNAVAYGAMKKDWGSSKEAVKRVEKILKNSHFKNIDKNIGSKKMKIKITNSSIQKIDKFVNKLLNTKLNITLLNISKNQVEIEVGLK